MLEEKTVGFAMCGSFCTHSRAMEALEQVKARFAHVVPIVSEYTAAADTRFGDAHDLMREMMRICDHRVISTIKEAEPIGPQKLLDLLIIWVGNLLGTMLIAGIETLTGIVGPESGINVTAAAMVDGKMGDSYLSLFLLGILCNICIFIAVNGYAKNPHQLGKYLALFLGVTVFIVSGMEHSVADMYYWSVSGVLYGQPGESLLRLVVISLGNVVGGVFFPVVESWKAKLEAVKAEVT